MASDTSLVFDILARDRASAEFNKIKGSALTTGAAIDKAFDKSELAGRFNQRIHESKVRLGELNEEFRKTGDIDLLKGIKDERATLSGLQSSMRAVRKEFEDANQDVKTFGDGLENGISGAFSSMPSEAKLAIAATGAAIVGVLGPVIASALAAGVTAGVGGAALFAGIKLAARDPAVATEFSQLGARINERLTQSVSPFKAELVGVAHIFGESFDRVAPGLDRVFASLAPHIKPLAEGLTSLVERAMPGIERVVKSAGPLFDQLAQDLPVLGGAMSDFFGSVADAGPGANLVLSEMVRSIAATIEGLGLMIRSLGQVTNDIAIAGAAFGLWDPGKPATYAKVLGDASVSATSLGQSGQAAFYGLDQKERDALSTVERLNAAFDDTRNKMLALSNANIAVASDFAQLNSQFERGKHALDINYEAGRRNQTMINDTIGNLIRQRDAAIEAGGGTKAAFDAAGATFRARIKDLEDLLVKMGVTRQAAHALLAEFYDKTITVTVRVRQVGSVSQEGVISSSAGGDQRRNTGQAYASGTDYARGGLALVGEMGPELVNLPAGSEVFTAGETRQMMRGSATGSGVQQTQIVFGSDGTQLGDQILPIEKTAVRLQGGNGAVLGIVN